MECILREPKRRFSFNVEFNVNAEEKVDQLTKKEKTNSNLKGKLCVIKYNSV